MMVRGSRWNQAPTEYLAILVNGLAAQGISAERVVTTGNATDGIVWAADPGKA